MSYNFEVVYGLPILNPNFGQYIGVASNGNAKIMFAIELSKNSSTTNIFRVWRSQDFGNNWNTVFTKQLDDFNYSYIGDIISVNTSGKFVIFVLGYDVYFSKNGGTTFTKSTPDINGICVNCSIGQIPIGGVIPFIFISSILIDNNSCVSIFRSNNAGKTWSRKIQVTGINFLPIVTSSTNNSTSQYVYFSTGNLLYTSSNNGNTFTSQEINQNSNTVMFIKTNGNGKFIVAQGYTQESIGFLKTNNLFNSKKLKDITLNGTFFILSTNYGESFTEITDNLNQPLTIPGIGYGCPTLNINAQRIIVTGIDLNNEDFYSVLYLGDNRNNTDFNRIFEQEQDISIFFYVNVSNTSDNYISKIISASGGVVTIGTQV